MKSFRSAFVVLLLIACGNDEPKGKGDLVQDAGGGKSSRDAGAGGAGGVDGTSDAGGATSAEDAAADVAPLPERGEIVQTPLGPIQGYKDGSTQRFLGIRYAKAPEGDLRWKPPVPVDAWTDVLDARDYGPACAQPSWIQGPESVIEDCLFLNVWTPDTSPATPLPVMVWLPGGGNENGSASDVSPLTGNELIYAGRDLATDGDVVVVTLNYRVGAFGFFSHPGLTAEGSNSGNQGLMDQRAALEWVRDNVAVFGGDPRKVTLFGESAGAQDTCLQVMSPASRGLFHRAISQSGGCTTYRKTNAAAEAQGTAFAEAVGCGAATDQLACLRGKSAKELLVEAPVDGLPDGGVSPGGSRFSGGTPRWEFDPVVDGAVVPDQPRRLVEAGDFAKVPYILGSNFEEGKLFLLSATPVTTDEEYTAALGRLFGADGAGVAAMYPSSTFSDPMAALVRVWGDYRLGCPTYDSAARIAAQGVPVRIFAFMRTIPGLEVIGPTHGVELPYVFGTLPTPTPEDIEVSSTMQGYWSRFAATGDPNGDGAVDWPAFAADTYDAMSLDATLSIVSDYRKAQCEFWQTIYAGQF